MRFSLRDLLIVVAVIGAALRFGAWLSEPVSEFANGLRNESVAMDTSGIAPQPIR